MKKILIMCATFGLSYVNAQSWSEQIKIQDPNNQAGNRYGQAVSISGNLAVVGAPTDNKDNNNANQIDEAGAVFIYKRTSVDDDWTFLSKLTASDRQAFDYFGQSVALNGSTLAVGAPFEAHDDQNVSVPNSGSVYIYKIATDGTVTFEQKIKATDRESGDNFGMQVKISDDYIVVSAPSEDHNSSGSSMLNNAGSVYIFENQGTWQQAQKITPTDRTAGDKFGDAIALHEDRILIGTRFSGLNEAGVNPISFAGSAYFYERNTGGQWLFTQKVVAQNREATSWFGASVALSADHAIIGAWGEDRDATDQNVLTDAGAAYILTRQVNGTWLQTQKIVSPDRAANNHFGFSVGLSGDNALIGSRSEGTPSISGKVHFIKYDGTSNWVQNGIFSASDAAANNSFGTAVAIDNTSAIIGDNAEGAYAFEYTCNIQDGVDTQSSCGPIVWLDGNTYSSNNTTATHTIVGGAVNGCDSLVTLNLTIIPSLDTTIALSNGVFTATQSGVTYQWIDCNNGNAPIAGAIDQTFTPTTNGNYAVILTTSGCNSTSECLSIMNVGIESINENLNITVVPNPSNGTFEIQTKVNSAVEITDLAGRLVYKNQLLSGSNTVQLTEQAGTYLVKIIVDQQQVIKRIVIH